MDKKIDYKKEYKDLYQPKTTPAILTVPDILYIAVDGSGAPESPFYQEAIEILYALSFTIKMSKMGENKPEGYFEYVVPPLESLWDLEGEWFDSDRDKWVWRAMIRQPEFVTQDIFSWACREAQQKKPDLDFSRARLIHYDEGECAQIMHIGPYSTELESINKMKEYIEEQGYTDACGSERWHHEIYLSDPRKTASEKLRTILRHPVEKLR